MTQAEFNAWIRARFNLWTKADVDAEVRKAVEQALAQRPWLGLTENEIEKLFQTAADADEEVHIRFATALQAKLKERNT